MKIVKVNDLSKEYTGKVPHTALSNIDLTIMEGGICWDNGTFGKWENNIIEYDFYY